MKYLVLTLIGSFFLLSNGCDKQEDLSEVVIVRDCTGTYFRDNNKDYKVCNLPVTEPYADGDTLLASYTVIEECTDPSQPEVSCMMYHEHESWITVEAIAE